MGLPTREPNGEGPDRHFAIRPRVDFGSERLQRRRPNLVGEIAVVLSLVFVYDRSGTVATARAGLAIESGCPDGRVMAASRMEPR